MKFNVYLSVFVHLLVIFCFFTSPFWSLWYQLAFLFLALITLPIRIKFFEGKCPFTKWEREARLKIGDREAKIHRHTFMETYFGMPDKVFKILEKAVLVLLVLSIAAQIFWGRSWWDWL